MGVVPKQATVYEVLEEVALTVQHQLVDSPLPFCAFNGGQDVFVDIGNKSIGLEALMKHLDVSPPQVECSLLGLQDLMKHFETRWICPPPPPPPLPLLQALPSETFRSQTNCSLVSLGPFQQHCPCLTGHGNASSLFKGAGPQGIIISDSPMVSTDLLDFRCGDLLAWHISLPFEAAARGLFARQL